VPSISGFASAPIPPILDLIMRGIASSLKFDPVNHLDSARLPDTVRGVLTILVSNRIGPRKRAALLLVLEGVGYRRAAGR
jgi:hypothetical protein